VDGILQGKIVKEYFPHSYKPLHPVHKKYDFLSDIVRQKYGTEKFISKTLLTILYYKTIIWHKKMQNLIKIKNLFLKILRLREEKKSKFTSFLTQFMMIVNMCSLCAKAFALPCVLLCHMRARPT
jgi:hypothetical protein